MSSADSKKMDKSKHIVVVDDDIVSLDIMSYLFERKGYQVHRCADGVSAVEYIAKYKPDVVLLDLMMPNVNGIETVELLKQKGFSNIPIIAFTAIDDALLHKEALDVGCQEVLTKPCPAEKLLASINKYLRN